MVKDFIKAGMMAIALTAATATMAQTTEKAADASTGATAIADSSAMRHHRQHRGEMKAVTCPSCGHEFAPRQHRGKHDRHNGKHNGKHAGQHNMWHNGNQKDFKRPEVGCVVDTLPGKAMSYVKEGQQLFQAYGVVYEPKADNGVVKYVVVEVKEPHHPHAKKPQAKE